MIILFFFWVFVVGAAEVSAQHCENSCTGIAQILALHTWPVVLVVGTSDYLETRLNTISGNSLFTLKQNYPNPFTQHTTINFSVPSTDELNLGGLKVSIHVYNIEGKLIKTLVPGDKKAPGNYNINWQGQTDNGQKAPAGIYIYRITVEGWYESKKFMTLLK